MWKLHDTYCMGGQGECTLFFHGGNLSKRVFHQQKDPKVAVKKHVQMRIDYYWL